MELIYSIFIGITRGLIIGILAAFVLHFLRKKRGSQKKYTEQELERMANIRRQISGWVKIITFGALLIGLVWTIYYLILGVVDPSQTEYATAVSQLIVSVLTIFSIIIAFYQFLREK